MPAAAAPRKTLIFHVGDHKTGSTSIQLAFAQDQVSVEGVPIFYPAQISSNAMAEQCRIWAGQKRPKARAAAAQGFRRKAQRIAKHGPGVTLISAESMEGTPPPVLHAIAQEFFAEAVDEIRVIAYVRPHAARILSSYAERVKTGGQMVLEGTLEDFHDRSLAAGEFLYHPRFSAWREAFGDAFTLRPMTRSELFRGSVVDDFVRTAFRTESFTIAEAGQANESLDLVDLMRLKVLQQSLHDGADRDLRRTLGWEFARLVGQMPPPARKTRLALHRALAERIRDAYLDDARAVDADFFDGRPVLEGELDQALAQAVAEPQSTDPADYLPAEELRAVELFSRLAAGMLENTEVKWPAFLHSKRLQDMLEVKAAVADAAE